MLFVTLFTFSIILFIEYKKYRSFSSPAALSVLSYTVAIVAAFLGKRFFKYQSISDYCYFIILVSIIVVWLPSFMFYANSAKTHELKSCFVPSFSNNAIFLLLLGLLVIGVYGSLRYGGIGSETFENQYSHGIFAHIRNLFSVIITYLLCFSKKTKKVVIVIMAGVFFVFLSGTKYHLFFIFLPLLIMQLRKPTMKKMFFLAQIGGLVCIFLFAVNYFVGFLLRGMKVDNFNSFIINHLLKYIGGGLIGFSEYLNNIPAYSNGFRWIDTAQLESTNVYTLIGGYFMSDGYIGLVYIFIISIIGYLAFFLIQYSSIKQKDFVFLFYCYLFGIPMLLSFFASYYGLLNIWEMSFFSLFIFVLLQKRLLNPILKFDVTNKGRV